MILTEAPGSIEGEKIFVIGKNIKTPKAPKQITDKLYLFVVDIKGGGNGEIEEEFNPKTYKFHPDSHLNKGDKVEGKQLYGYCKKPKKLSVGGKARTAKHKNQHTTMNDCCFLQITSGWKGDAITKHPKNMYFPNLVV